MKKLIRILLVTVIAVLALCCVAMAVEADPPYVEGTVTGATVTLASGNEKVDAAYENAAITAGGQYMFFLVKANGAGAYIPGESSIIYMNQVTATASGTVSITGMFPQKLDDCAVMISGTGLAAPQILGYVVVPEPPYTLGDVNNDTGIDGLDASVILRYVANYTDLDETQKLAGDVDGNGAPDGLDASWILRYVAFRVELEDFPAAKK